jgi:hypothetical protein
MISETPEFKAIHFLAYETALEKETKREGGVIR